MVGRLELAMVLYRRCACIDRLRLRLSLYRGHYSPPVSLPSRRLPTARGLQTTIRLRLESGLTRFCVSDLIVLNLTLADGTLNGIVVIVLSYRWCR